MPADDNPLPRTRRRLCIEFDDGVTAPAELPHRGKLVIGASERADVLLEGAGVDPVHCAIGRLKGGGWALKDMGSAAGTRVNGERMDSARLAHGDLIEIGARRLRVVDPALPAPAPEPPEGAVRPTAAGEDLNVRISGYRIQRAIGRGGMGQVFLAVQERLDRQVALKILPPRLAADAEFVKRFEDEARAAAALNHPNVVTIYDVGVEDDKHYLSMEYMHDGCLESRLAREGTLPWREVLRVLQEAAAGLVYAESRGIVHRDIKPSNLMQNEDGVTKIADLGLAVQTEHDDTDGQRIYGTPHFIAPELVRGEKPDSRSDLYSLGATAFRLITGHTPFEGQTPKEILRQVLSEPAPRLRERSPDVPEAFAKVVDRLLCKDPIERHPSAQILLRELEHLRDEDARGPLQPSGSGFGTKILLVGLGATTLAAAVLFGKAYLDDADEPQAADASAERVVVNEPPALLPDTSFDESLESPGSDTEDDMAARLFETEAELEYLKLGEFALGDAERVTRLRELAKRYKGTNISRRAETEALQLESGRLAALEESREREAALQRAVSELESAVRDVAATRPAQALTALAGVAAPASAGSAFGEARARVEREVFERGIGHARATLERADELLAAGAFEDLEGLLRGFVEELELPAYGADDERPQLALELEELAARAFSRLGDLDATRARWLAEQELEDRRRIASRLREGDALLEALERLDCASALALLSETRASVATERADLALAELTRDVELADGALQALVDGWSSDAWRRKTVADPRGSRAANREALGADAQGLLLEHSGSPEHVAWSSWSGSPRELHILFNERLTRPWSPEELAGIAALFRMGAVAHAARWARSALADRGRPGTNSARSAPDEVMAEFFEAAREWAREAHSEDRLEPELQAVELLRRGLAAVDDGSPTIAIVQLERLLGEHERTLFVMLLSEGASWRERPRDAPHESTVERAGEPADD